MGFGKLGFPATHCDRMYGNASPPPRLFLQVNAATLQTQRRCCTAWACYQSCCSACVTPAWLSKRFNSYVASSHPCSRATSPFMTSAGAVRLQMNGKRPAVFFFLLFSFLTTMCLCVQTWTLPGLHTAVSRQHERKQCDVWRWSFNRWFFFTRKSLFAHLTNVGWSDSLLPHQFRVPIQLASYGSEISCCSSCRKPSTQRPFS